MDYFWNSLPYFQENNCQKTQKPDEMGLYRRKRSDGRDDQSYISHFAR